MAISPDVEPGTVDPRAGRAAFDFLTTAIDLALAGRIDAITTLPLNKQALHQGGIDHPGHTEILAERCGVPDHAMMLYLETDSADSGRRRSVGPGRGPRDAARRPAAGVRPVEPGVDPVEDPPGRPGDASPDRRPARRESP